MRTGLRDLRAGRLDKVRRLQRNVPLCGREAHSYTRACLSHLLWQRDMRVMNELRVVAMSPPTTRGGAEGTILELSVKQPPGPLPMFGSLLALSQRANFMDAIWATVAGTSAESAKGGRLHIFIEVSAQLNETTDAALLASLLRHSGRLFLAESPTFYRAYAPAITQLQQMKAATMPFYHEIVFGHHKEIEYFDDNTIDASVVFEIEYFDDNTIDASVVFSAASDSSALARMPIHNFCELLYGATDHYREHRLKTTLDDSQREAILQAIEQPIAIIQGPPGTGKTFVGVRIVRLLRSLSIEDQGPILVMTYKNRALDDFLTDCLSIWPEGVARLGGTAQPGSLLEHRHINMLIKSERRTEEHEAAKARAEQSSQAVQAAAQALAAARYFYPSSFINHPSEWALSSLLLEDETIAEEDRAEIKAELASGSHAKLESRATQACALWMPKPKECAKLCRQLSPPSDSEASLASSSGVGGASDEQKERADDRDRYRWFETTAIRFNASDATSREVIELIDPGTS